MKSAIPDEPKQAAQDAVTGAKDSLPEAPSNPFQGFFSGKQSAFSTHAHTQRHTPDEQTDRHTPP